MVDIEEHRKLSSELARVRKQRHELRREIADKYQRKLDRLRKKQREEEEKHLEPYNEKIAKLKERVLKTVAEVTKPTQEKWEGIVLGMEEVDRRALEQAMVNLARLKGLPNPIIHLYDTPSTVLPGDGHLKGVRLWQSQHGKHAVAGIPWRGELRLQGRSIGAAFPEEVRQRIPRWHGGDGLSGAMMDGATACEVEKAILKGDVQEDVIAKTWKAYSEAMSLGAWVFGYLEKEDGTHFYVLLPPKESHTILRNHGSVLHNDEGPAVMWQNGEREYFHNGVKVSERIIEEPETITVNDIITETNQEVKQVMLECFGVERFAEEAGATVRDEDTDLSDNPRKLLRISLGKANGRGDRFLQLVQVICPSTGRLYHLRVPPTVETCHEAVAWTFTKDLNTYKVVAES